VPKQNVPVEQVTFAGGLITEANPLNFPPNASLDEVNFVAEKDGTRRRRLGMTYETDHTVINSTVVPTADNKVVFSSFVWENAGGDPERQVSVVQSGSVIKFFDTLTTPLSGAELYSYDTGTTHSTFFSFAVVDGTLVVAVGQKDILLFHYDSGVISETTDILRTRDMFGVDDSLAISQRDGSLTVEHTYNLRNQSFSVPRLPLTGDTVVDTIGEFEGEASVFPSNADAVHYNLYPNVSESNRTADRFNVKDLTANPPGTTPAASGHFIIDALERGASRLVEYADLLSQHPELS